VTDIWPGVDPRTPLEMIGAVDSCTCANAPFARKTSPNAAASTTVAEQRDFAVLCFCVL
jgi:hypothetical protein